MYIYILILPNVYITSYPTNNCFLDEIPDAPCGTTPSLAPALATDTVCCSIAFGYELGDRSMTRLMDDDDLLVIFA